MPKYSPEKMRVGVSTQPTMRTYIKSGQAIVPESLLKTVQSMNVGQPPKFEFDGKYVHFYVPESVMLSLKRIEAIPLNQSRIEAAMNTDLKTWMLQLVGEMQQLAMEIVDKQIYETKPRLRRYKPKKIYKTFNERNGNVNFFNKPRTFNLRRAVVQGIRYENGTLIIGINDSLAPYWVYVEHGHKVVIPRYNRRTRTVVPWEPGTFVEGRPFMNRIRQAIQHFIKERVLPVLNAYLKTTEDILLQWTLGSMPSARQLVYPELGVGR